MKKIYRSLLISLAIASVVLFILPIPGGTLLAWACGAGCGFLARL